MSWMASKVTLPFCVELGGVVVVVGGERERDRRRKENEG